ncbi:MAG: hypothetical protein N2509_06665, partial [Treponemataceae bacterium]|nr:hypothetical protein [Treponemataceae bacterium]
MKEKESSLSLLVVISRSLVRTFAVTMAIILLLWSFFAVFYTLETVKKDSLAVQGVVHTTLT